MKPISYRIGYQGEPNINWVEVHPQLSNNRYPVDGALVGAGSLWPLGGNMDLLQRVQGASILTHAIIAGEGSFERIALSGFPLLF
jgi:hypothetical protein